MFDLAELRIAGRGLDCRLTFSAAQLAIVNELGSRLWYIDLTGVVQTDVLQHFNSEGDIRVTLSAVTAGGRKFEGAGYLHPNVLRSAAAIRGEGELIGYE